jgi:hypothetical protein
MLARNVGQSPAPVVVDPGLGALAAEAYYSRDDGRIYVSKRLIADNHPRAAVNALVHEGRHRYQLTLTSSHAPGHKVRSWARNSEHYRSSRGIITASAIGFAMIVAAGVAGLALPVVAVQASVAAGFATWTAAAAKAVLHRMQPMERDAYRAGNTAARRTYSQHARSSIGPATPRSLG